MQACGCSKEQGVLTRKFAGNDDRRDGRRKSCVENQPTYLRGFTGKFLLPSPTATDSSAKRLIVLCLLPPCTAMCIAQSCPGVQCPANKPLFSSSDPHTDVCVYQHSLPPKGRAKNKRRDTTISMKSGLFPSSASASHARLLYTIYKYSIPLTAKSSSSPLLSLFCFHVVSPLPSRRASHPRSSVRRHHLSISSSEPDLRLHHHWRRSHWYHRRRQIGREPQHQCPGYRSWSR